MGTAMLWWWDNYIDPGNLYYHYLALAAFVKDGQMPACPVCGGILKPNVILLDIKLPHMDGIEAARQIHRDCPDTNVLMLSSYEDESHVMEAIQAGAKASLNRQYSTIAVVGVVLLLVLWVLLGWPTAFTNAKDQALPCGKVASEWVGNPVRPEIAALPAPAEP